MARPGNTANHHAPVFCREADNNEPHVSDSAGTPIPKKDKVASVKIADAIPKAMAISTGDKALGIACLKTILLSE